MCSWFVKSCQSNFNLQLPDWVRSYLITTVYWLLGKHLSNFVSPAWKLDNSYCQTAESALLFQLFLSKWVSQTNKIFGLIFTFQLFKWPHKNNVQIDMLKILLKFGILLPKLLWPTVRFFFQILGLQPRISKVFLDH